VVALIGANGAGKSTALKTVSGLLKPRKGSISFKGEDLASVEAYHRIDRGMALCPEARRLFVELLGAQGRLAGGSEASARSAGGAIVAGPAPAVRSLALPHDASGSVTGDDAVLITGWWTRTGRRSLPDHVLVGSVRHRVIGWSRSARADVAAHLGRSGDEPFGFALLAVPAQEPAARSPLMRIALLGRDESIPAGDTVGFEVPRWGGRQGHADGLLRVKRALAISASSAKTIDVSAENDLRFVLLAGQELHASPSGVSHRQQRLRFGPGQADLYVSAGAIRPSLVMY
jgi:energy-coupling factor transporter ATP-binding protein EcfA2